MSSPTRARITAAMAGTSCAAPLWAAFTALVNQQAIANGQAVVGFLNPALYTIGKGASYTQLFPRHHHRQQRHQHAISRRQRLRPLHWLGHTQWHQPDQCSCRRGWPLPSSRSARRPALTSTGSMGGPFSPANQTYTVSNTGGSNLNWTASNTATWLTLSANERHIGRWCQYQYHRFDQQRC